MFESVFWFDMMILITFEKVIRIFLTVLGGKVEGNDLF